MDELRFAQFSRLTNCKQRLDILKKVNVNHEVCENKSYIGKNYLHVAVKSCNHCVKELLSLGVDLLKKTPNNETPLHLTMYNSMERKFFWKIMGPLKYETVDTLLSAQIKTGDTENPKDQFIGISHFHIACIANHVEAINFFLDAGESIDQAFDSGDNDILPGYTGLHCAIRHSSVEAVKILVDRGADIHMKDAEGKSPLHLLIERMMDLTDYVNMGKQACCLIIKEELKRMELIISYILKNRKEEEGNFADDTGLTAFHIACTLSETSVVENFLQQNVDINRSVNSDSDFWPGYTPLHFAVCFNIETVKLLLQQESSIITKNANGKTALDLCMERFPLKAIHSILSCKSEFKNILLSDGSTSLLDVLLLMDNCDKFKDFLQSLSDVNICVSYDSPLWPGNTLLHLSILMNEKTKNIKDFYKKTFFQENIDAPKESYNCSKSEELAYWKRIVMCLVRGCSLLSKNADGLTPIHLAFKLHKANIVDKLLNTCKDNVADPSNLTHFHIACIAGKKSLVELFLSQAVDVNCRVKRSFAYSIPREYKNSPDSILLQSDSTPLHLAVIFDQIEIVELLLQSGADVYAQDALGLTPIHLSLNVRYSSSAKSMAQLFLKKTSNLKEVVSKQGLTHLHVAAYADNDKAVDELLKAGSEVDALFEYDEQKESNYYYKRLSFFNGKTPLYIAMSDDCGDAARALIRGGADISRRLKLRKPTVTVLIYGVSRKNSDFRKFFINKLKREYKELIGPIDTNGMTLLHVACISFDLMWVKKLLERGADVNARISYKEYFQGGYWKGRTPLHMLIDEACTVDELPKNLVTLIKFLLKHGADLTNNGGTDTPLHLVHEQTNANKKHAAIFLSIENLFFKSYKSYNVNPTDITGLSHFHIACIRNNIEVVKNFLDHGIDINHHVDYYHREYTSGFTPLHFAFDNRHKDLARLLIERGANVKAEALNGDTPLHVALLKKFVDLEIIELLYRNGADFNAENLSGITPMMRLLNMENFTYKQFEFFLKCDCEFDIKYYRSREGIIGLAMRNAEPSERKMIFEKLMKTGELKNAISDGFNPIRSIVSVNHDGRLTLEFYIHAIKILMGMGCNFDQQDENGKSSVYNAVFFYNVEAFKALLHYGADLNVIDNKNKSPLSTTVISNSNIKQERKSAIVEMLLSHAWKMKFLGLLENSVEEDMLRLSKNNSSVYNTIMSRCENEFEKLENIKICNFLTAKSFIKEGPSTYPLMTSSERKCVDKFFKRSENIMQVFPEFGGLLNMQYRKAVFAMKQLDSSEKS